MTSTVFQHSSPKTQIEYFWSNVYFFPKLYSFTNSAEVIKNFVIVFIKLSFYKGFLVLVFKVILFLNETLHVNKFENANFKYDFSFLKSQPKMPNLRQIWSQIWDFFGKNFVCGKIWGCLCKMPPYQRKNKRLSIILSVRVFFVEAYPFKNIC